MNTKHIFLVSVACMLATPVYAASNLVTNGNFETTGLSGNFEFSGTYAAGAGKVTGWSSTGGYNLLFNASNASTPAGNAAGEYSYTGDEYLWSSAASRNGGNFIAMDGDQSMSNRAVTQTINGLTVGQNYTLSFEWAGGQLHSRSGSTTDQIQVGFGNDTFNTAVISNVSGGFTGWRTVTTNFTAKNTSQLLSFLSVGTPQGLPPMALLDGVSLTAAVPEPASWAMMIGGFGMVGGVMRRARTKVATFA